jgi:hypothetical protein
MLGIAAWPERDLRADRRMHAREWRLSVQRGSAAILPHRGKQQGDSSVAPLDCPRASRIPGREEERDG